MAVNRVLYATQVCKIVLPDLNGGSANAQAGGYNILLPIQTASADETIPQDDVLVMGKIGGVARVQKDVATTKCSVKAFLASAGKFNDGSSGTWPGANYHGATDEMAEFLSDLEALTMLLTLDL